MKTIGMIGGMSWESSLEYYRLINEITRRERGGLHSAKSLLYSVDFEEIELLQHQDRWEDLTGIMIDAARNLEKAGAESLLICTNTMHKMADQVQQSVSIPLLHIADAAGEEIRARGLKTVALLGTRFTMEQDFYRERLARKFGLNVMIPEEEDRAYIHQVIYRELCLGEIRDASKKEFLRIIGDLEQKGARGVVLGCTEIPLLIRQEDLALPVFDTTAIHAEYAVRDALSEI